MKSTYRDIPYLGEGWDFWFSRERKRPKKITTNIKKGSYYFILNSDTCKMEFISSSIEDVLGFSSSEFCLDKFFSIIHPDDLPYCRSCEMDALKLCDKLLYNEHYRYSFHYSLRVKDKNGQYHTIQQQYQTIEVDEHGHSLKTLVLHEKIDDYEDRPKEDFKIYDKLKNKPVSVLDISKLTKRELEVLELVQRGFKSDEISEILYLSKLTVDTHRRNILHKTNTHSLTELIREIEH